MVGFVLVLWFGVVGICEVMNVVYFMCCVMFCCFLGRKVVVISVVLLVCVMCDIIVGEI